MIDDPVVEEVRDNRQAHSARFNYDFDAIAEQIMHLSAKSVLILISYFS
jgi:hypothetical protein